MKIFLSSSGEETQHLAGKFARDMLETPDRKPKGAFVVGLKGDLGSGKTTFAQGFARSLGIQEKVLSPTFVIIKSYPLRRSEARPAKRGGKIQNLYHIDCYRIKDEKDILKLGWDNIVSDPKNIILIEWPERIQKILPKDAMSISFETTKTSKAHERRITFS